MAFTEANLRNYAGLYLKVEGDGDHRRLRCDLSPLPGQKEIKVRSKLPLSSPWRVILIGTHPGRFIESNLILNLNEPSAIADISWLRFGKTTWYWWNGPYQEPVDFIRQVPTTWDETRVLSGKVSDYIVVARRKGLDWYLGAMTDWTPRVLEVPLSFLAHGRYQVEVWADAAESADPNRLTYQKRTVDAQEKLVLRLSSGGGQAVRIQPTKE